jgi:hypothetical protein
MFGKNELDNLITKGRADEAKLRGLQKEFAALRPRWVELQERAEHLAAAVECRDRTYTRVAAQELWNEREVTLRRDLEVVLLERDQLTEGICQEINELKGRIFQRNSMLAGDLGSWASAVATKLPEDSPLRAALLEDRRKAEESKSIEGIISIVTGSVARAEAARDINISLPNLPVWAERALAAA